MLYQLISHVLILAAPSGIIRTFKFVKKILCYLMTKQVNSNRKQKHILLNTLQFEIQGIKFEIRQTQNLILVLIVLIRYESRKNCKLFQKNQVDRQTLPFYL